MRRPLADVVDWTIEPTSAAEPTELTLRTDRAVANPTTLPDREGEVPLAEYRVVGAEALTGGGRRRALDLWKLHVAGPDVDLVLKGEWLDLAWAGHLGGWPEPPPRNV